MDSRARAQLNGWMARLADGDRGAIQPAYEGLWPLVRSFAARVLSNPADADDAAQQALLKVFERACDFDPARDAASWVFTIVAFECRTIRRRTERRREDGDGPALDLLCGDRTPEDALIARDLEAAARELVASLRPDDAKTILDAMAKDRDEASGPTLRKRLQRALARLRVLWREKHGTE